MKTWKFGRTALVIALAMTIILSVTGGTIAWFTDEVTSAKNVIQAGNLDMVVSYKPYGAQNTTWTVVDENTPLFNEDALYEPGYTEAFWLKVENNGSLAFRYQTALNILAEKAGTNKAGESFNLSDYLVVKATPVMDLAGFEAFYDKRADLDSFNFKEIVLSAENLVMTNNNVIIPGSAEHYVLVVLQMPTTVGNEANHNGNVPKIDLGLNVLATQVPYEEDSFGADYDAEATYPKVENNNDNRSIMQELKGDKLNIVCSEDWLGVTPFGERVYGPVTLDCGVVLSATETDVEGSPYEKCYVDILLSCDKAIVPGNEITLAGHYDFMSLAESGEWLGAKVNDLDIKAGDRVEVMKNLFGNPMRYDEIVDYVKEFYCGVIADDSFNGATITMELCMYDEFDYDFENPTVVETYSYKFQ